MLTFVTEEFICKRLKKVPSPACGGGLGVRGSAEPLTKHYRVLTLPQGESSFFKTFAEVSIDRFIMLNLFQHLIYYITQIDAETSSA